MEALGPDLLKVVEIIWVNVILSGDNAVVIAMACRGLPPDKQRIGMALGAGVAVVLRIVFTIIIAFLLATPFLKIVGGVLLLWIAIQLLVGNDGDEGDVEQTSRLWHAVRTVAIADAVMSLDNVLAIAAIAKDSTALLVLGLAISIPLIVAGASVIIKMLERLPILVWAGAALLGWIAGDMIASDPALLSRVGEASMHRIQMPAAAAGAAFVLLVGFLLRRRHAAANA